MEQEDDMRLDDGNGDQREVVTDAKPFLLPYYEIPPQASEEGAISSSTPRDSPHYNMKHKHRGKALIVNFMEFSPQCMMEPDQKEKIQLDERTGSEVDVESLTRTFEYLNFEVEILDTDVTEAVLKEKLLKVSLENHTDRDCLVVVVMTHGQEDHLWAKDKLFQVNDLWQYFTADNCATLAGKPKLFFIQACRGDQPQQGVWLKDEIHTGEKELYTIPTMSDILIMQSTVKGFSSSRHLKEGTWFIQSLCKELLENGKKRSLLSLMTSVTRSVAVDYAHVKQYGSSNVLQKQQPVLISTLTRELYFEDK